MNKKIQITPKAQEHIAKVLQNDKSKYFRRKDFNQYYKTKRFNGYYNNKS